MLTYLIEPITVTLSGNLTGKSIRTYELRNNVFTGVMYSLKKGILVKSSGTKSLNMWRSTLNAKTYSSIPKMNGWSYYYFTTPELAILAKLVSYTTQLATVKANLQRTNDNLLTHANYTSKFIPFVSEHPELLL